MNIELIRYILNIILGTLIGLPVIGCFLSVFFGTVYHLIYPSRAKRALNLTIVGISFSISALIVILVLLSPLLVISYSINK
jgi:hypothetical protein